MLKRLIKSVFCLSAIWFSSHATGHAQVVVNPDGSHSVVAGNIVINPNGTHSVIAGNVVINPNGTHSVITGNVVVNPNGTHSVLVGNPPTIPNGANTLNQYDSGDENTSYRRPKRLDNKSITWFEYRQARLARKEERRKAREIRRLMAKENGLDTKKRK